MRTRELFHFIKERHAIWIRRNELNHARPWTKDPILQTYRFTNVYRELDAVTLWIADNWRGVDKLENDDHYDKSADELRYTWFAMCVARFINLPAVMEELGYPVPWDAKHYLKVMRARKARGEAQMNGAYKIKPGPHKDVPTVDYIARRVLTPLWKDREKITPVICNETLGTVPPPTLALVHELLMRYNGLGSFMAAQVVADLKYTLPLRNAADWNTFAAPGPGSKRGLNWVFKRDFYAPWNAVEWRDKLLQLKEKTDVLVSDLGYPALHAQDLQSCLCELGKYVKVQQGWGRPRRRFNGGEE